MTKKNRPEPAIAVQGHLKPLCGDNNPLPTRLRFAWLPLLSTGTDLFRGPVPVELAEAPAMSP